MTDDERDVLREQWRACADDLERWARALASNDPESEKYLRILVQRMRDRAAAPGAAAG